MKFFLSISIVMYFSLVQIFAQAEYELAKDEEGIKIWLKDSQESAYKEFKAETIFEESMDDISETLSDIENAYQYYDVISKVEEITILDANNLEYVLYYNFPWPVEDRFTKVRFSTEKLKQGLIKIVTQSVQINDNKDNFVKVKDMWSSWILEDLGNNKTKVTHTGFMDPAGSIPAWIANTSIVDSPFSALKKLKNIIRKGRD